MFVHLTQGRNIVKYIFNECLFDIVYPIIIKGNKIPNKSIVTIYKDKIDPAEKLVWIEDVDGNIQSTYRSSLYELIG